MQRGAREAFAGYRIGYYSAYLDLRTDGRSAEKQTDVENEGAHRELLLDPFGYARRGQDVTVRTIL